MAARNDDPTTETPSTPSGVRRLVTAGVSYALFGAGIVLLYAFFAPFLGTPAVPGVSALPVVTAPTESDAIINVTPLIIGVVASAVAVRVR